MKDIISRIDSVFTESGLLADGTKVSDLKQILKDAREEILQLQQRDAEQQPPNGKDIIRSISGFLNTAEDVRQLVKIYGKEPIYLILDVMADMYKKHNILEYRDVLALKAFMQTIVY